PGRPRQSVVGRGDGVRVGLQEVRLVVVERHDRVPRPLRRAGVMIYWHVERRSVCIYSQLKSCSASEVAAMLEGVLHHCTSAEVERNYVDTHGASVVGFAFS